MNISGAYVDSARKHCGRSSYLVSLLAIAIAQYGLAAPTAADQTTQTRGYNVLHRFAGLNKEGVYPLSTPLVRDASGNLYGTTSEGGAYDMGSVFKVTPTGQMTVLHSFSGDDGSEPFGQIALDADGFLYGTTWAGGEDQNGTVFKVATTREGHKREFTTLYRFTNGADGGGPTSGVILDAAGNLYGVTLGGGAGRDGTLFQLTPSASLNVMYNFGAGDGEFALGLVRDAAGNIYGTDLLGGPYANSNCLQQSWILGFGCGMAFKVDPDGKETLLHVFSGVDGDGGSPAGPPALDSAGNLYGTTLVGGTGKCSGAWVSTGGCGTVFRIDAAGNYTVLYSFPGTGDNGAGPVGNLVVDSKGNIYGATEGGGSGNCSANIFNGGGHYTADPGCGVAFRLSAAGTETVLHQFSGSGDGGNPESGFVEGIGSQFLYGTTYSGGRTNKCGSGFGCGTVLTLHK